MTCEHLVRLENELLAKGIRETFRGQAWSHHCREWVYFDCYFPDLESTMHRLGMDPVRVKIHTHLGTHDGQEHGLVCIHCHDGIMGLHPHYTQEQPNAVIAFV